jgi:hypothetical protein
MVSASALERIAYDTSSMQFASRTTVGFVSLLSGTFVSVVVRSTRTLRMLFEEYNNLLRRFSISIDATTTCRSQFQVFDNFALQSVKFWFPG